MGNSVNCSRKDRDNVEQKGFTKSERQSPSTHPHEKHMEKSDIIRELLLITVRITLKCLENFEIIDVKNFDCQQRLENSPSNKTCTGIKEIRIIHG